MFVDKMTRYSEMEAFNYGDFTHCIFLFAIKNVKNHYDVEECPTNTFTFWKDVCDFFKLEAAHFGIRFDADEIRFDLDVEHLDPSEDFKKAVKEMVEGWDKND